MSEERDPELYNRLDHVADERGLRPDSLIGSFFHSGHERGWQGCVVAEPHAGTYLIELFSWMHGESTHQRLIPLRTMVEEGWLFYDTEKWAASNYEHGGILKLWHKKREEERAANGDQ